jgi:hypothetical protein
LVVSIRTTGGKLAKVVSHASPMTRHTAFDESIASKDMMTGA